MTVNELITSLDFKPLCLPEPSKEVIGGYAGDLLSWVMGKATSGCAWITIMSNVNVIAVASLADTACIILAEDVALDETVKNTAEAKGINVLSTKLSAYEAAVVLSGLI